jgi:hypothetical protein
LQVWFAPGQAPKPNRSMPKQAAAALQSLPAPARQRMRSGWSVGNVSV